MSDLSDRPSVIADARHGLTLLTLEEVAARLDPAALRERDGWHLIEIAEELLAEGMSGSFVPPTPAAPLGLGTYRLHDREALRQQLRARLMAMGRPDVVRSMDLTG